MATADTRLEPPVQLRRGQELPRHVYPVRALGVAAGLLAVTAVFREIDVPLPVWMLVAFNGVIWPHLAFLAARSNADPWTAERRNLLIDAALGGIWVPLMGFNLLPSVLILSMMSLGVLSVGGPRLLAWMWATVIATGSVTLLVAETEIRTQTSFGVMVACLPLILFYPISIGVASYRLRHRIRDQKQQLDHLLRTERLSGLATRQHWEEALGREFERCRRTGRPAGLILVDVDEFKSINDRFGHLAGDEVIRRMGEILRRVLRPTDVACRYGGDEFGVLVVDSDAAGAAVAAERVREAVRLIRLESSPEMKCSVSLGVAEVGAATASPLEAIEHADRALYLAKAAGRNNVHIFKA